MDSRCVVLTLGLEQLRSGLYVHPHTGQFVNLRLTTPSSGGDDGESHQNFPWMPTFFLGIYVKGKETVDLRPGFAGFLSQFDEWTEKPEGSLVLVTEVPQSAGIIARTQHYKG